MSIQLNQLLERTLARAAFLLKKLKSEFEEEGDRKDGCVGGGGDNENLQTSAVALKVIPGAVVVVCVAAVS